MDVELFTMMGIWLFLFSLGSHGYKVDYFCVNRPLKNSDISLMDDNLNEWGEEETSDTKRFKVSRAMLHISLLMRQIKHFNK